MGEYLIPIGIISLLILFNGVFVAAEFSIVADPPTRMAQLAEDGSGAARHVLNILRDPDRQNRYITTAQVGITIVSLGLGMYGEHVLADWFVVLFEGLGELAETTAHTLATVLAVGLLTYLHVVIGEMIPKSLALQAAEPTVLALDRPMLLTERLFRPLISFLNFLGNRIVGFLGIPPAGSGARLYSPEELEFIVDESFEEGLLESREQLFIENIFDLSERTIGQVMTPRTRVVAFQVDDNGDGILRRVCEKGQTRYPIYEETLDRIVGILHVKDLARRRVAGEEPIDVRALVRPAVFLPESLTLEKTLLRFRSERIQLAMVLDEYGGTAGLITLEDLIEEVVGEIRDEFDQEIELIEEVESELLRVRGDLLLDELEQLYNLDLGFYEADTVGGLVMASLGRIPHPGDQVTFAGVIFEVEAVEGLAVQTLLVRLPS